MVRPILFAAALGSVCTTASPLIKRDNGNCFNATIRKEFLLSINTYQPYDHYKSDVNNVNQIRLNIADPTNQNQNAIECADAIWNSTQQSLPSGPLTCSDPTISYQITSYTKDDTFSVIINQTFIQGDFSETVLASYNATPSDLNGGTCYPNKGCSSWYIGVRTHSSYFTFRQTTDMVFHRVLKDMRSCTTSRRTARHRPPSLPSVHQRPYLRQPTGQSGTAPTPQKTPRTPPSLSQATSSSTS